MHTFFHGWRRKTGCVVLVVAIALTGCYVRSLRTVDAFAVVVANRQQLIFSTHGQIVWLTWSPEMPQLPTNWSSYDIDFEDDDTAPDDSDWSVSHWLVIAPLTLLSAYLILWKPRKRA
jgi:hypothetical protein